MTEEPRRPEDGKAAGGGGGDDWVERLARLAGRLGMNEVQVRWRLRRFQQRARDRASVARTQAGHLAYRHKVCPGCGRVNDESARKCAGCGARLGGRLAQFFMRVGLRLPAFVSVSSLLGLGILLVYARVVLAEGRPDSVLNLQVATLLAHGGNFPPANLAGEWWRLATAVFLHASLWHLGFNLFALSQIGPPIEKIFGRGRMLLLFMLTGVLASLGSHLLGLRGVGIGASGAIMGLCGLAAGWGQRDGTTVGRNVRNLMFKWALYTLVFGLLVRADHAAHAVGFGSGFAFGYLLKPTHLARSSRAGLRALEGVAGGLLALVAVGLCLLPPHSPTAERFLKRFDPAGGGNPLESLLGACAHEARGERQKALEGAREYLGEDAAGQMGERLPTFLETMCRGLAIQQAQCRRFRARGLAATYPEESLPRGEYERTQLERQLRGQCSWLLDGQPSLPEPPPELLDQALPPPPDLYD
jgi:rhomboid protease GluP